MTAALGGEYAPTQCVVPGVVDVTVTSTTSSHSSGFGAFDVSFRAVCSGRQETVNPAALRASALDAGFGIRIDAGSIWERGWWSSLNPPPERVRVVWTRLGEARERVASRQRSRARNFWGREMRGRGRRGRGGGAHPSGLGTALAHPRKNARTARVLETRTPMIARLESGAESSRCYPFICSFLCSSVLKRPSCRHSQWRRDGVAMREKPRPPVQVFAYDDTLGADEGRELESLLAYFPASAPVASKVRALSLARGIVGFASQFSIGSEGAEGADTAVRREDARVVRTKRGRLACLLATPSSRGSRTHGGGSRLWLCASLDDSIATSTAVRDGALVDALRILRDDHAMLHSDTSPPSSRNLSPLVADLGARLSPPTTGWVGMQSTHGGEKRLCGSALHALHSPLAPPTGCPLTSTSREVFLLTQSAVNAATLALDDWADDAKDDDNSDDDTDVNDKDVDMVADTAVFHEGGMLWSSATVRATRAIARYAERCLVPGVAFGEGDGVGVTRTRESDVAGASSREREAAGNSEAAEKVASTAARARALAAAVRAEAAAGISSLREARKRDGGTDAGGGEWGAGDAAEEGEVDEVPVSASEWSVAPDGFLRRSSAAGEAVEASGRDVPAAAYLLRLHAPAAGARMTSDDTSNDDSKSRDGSIYLLTLRVGSATLALSLRATRCPRLTDEDGWKALRRLCVDAAGPRLRELHESLALANSTGPSRRKKTLASIRGGSEPGTSLKASDHVPGYRYLYVDDATLAVRATPEAKLATVTFESLCAVQSVRREMEDEMSNSLVSIDDSGSSSIHELCVRARNDVWVVGKRATAPGDKGGTSTYGARDRWLWVVLERAGDTLLDASAAVGAFSEAHFDGVFDAS